MKMHVLNRQLNMFEVIEYEKKATLNESTILGLHVICYLQ